MWFIVFNSDIWLFNHQVWCLTTDHAEALVLSLGKKDQAGLLREKTSRTQQVVFKHVTNCYKLLQHIFKYFQHHHHQGPINSWQISGTIRKSWCFFSVPSGIQWWDCAISRWSAAVYEAKVFTSKRTKSSIHDLIEEDFRNMGMPQEPHLEGGSGSSGSSGSKWQVIFYKLMEKRWTNMKKYHDMMMKLGETCEYCYQWGVNVCFLSTLLVWKTSVSHFFLNSCSLQFTLLQICCFHMFAPISRK